MVREKPRDPYALDFSSLKAGPQPPTYTVQTHLTELAEKPCPLI